MRQGTRWEAVTDGGGESLNEDLVRVFEGDGDGAERGGSPTDILVLDGATALVDADADGGNRDVVWFVTRFADEFGRARAAGVEHGAMLAHAARAAGQAYAERIGGRELAPYAWPVASLSWLRVVRAGAGFRAHLTSLGDCKTVLRLPDGEVRDLAPIAPDHEAPLYDEVAALRADGVLDPKTRFTRMLPLLRARRTVQNMDPAPAVLSARPQGPYASREATVDVPPGSMLVAMSDGFWRPVDPYRQLSARAFLDACAADGLQAVLERLRTWEAGAGGAASLAVKRADDASAVAWHALS